ncbi:MAG: divalent metal cation transporter, partial [Acidobacteriota bacterium]
MDAPARADGARARWLQRLGGAVVTAAFLGPGTIATAGRAGASTGFALVWALLVAVTVCLVLQEAAARLALQSGRGLGAHLRDGAGGRFLGPLVVGAVVLGCAAYQAGNLLGAAAGLQLLADLPAPALAGGLAVMAGLLLITGRAVAVAAGLALLVATMG